MEDRDEIIRNVSEKKEEPGTQTTAYAKDLFVFSKSLQLQNSKTENLKA